MNKKNIKYVKNQIISGWIIKQVRNLPDLDLDFIELRHIATGARYAHIARADSENVFCVAFKTIPEDSSGIAHILEHTALAGSKNYPVRDPFFSMLKRSLNTFMNAFTGNDWTAYPFATENRKDFYNLLAVYLDAAFYPLLAEMKFKQEGIRLEFNGNELAYKGVVYNEMKGSMSSPERIMEQSILEALFPRGNYRFNSGGDPEVIPSLTHADLKKFHARYYQPSNAFFYSYGDLPLEGHLRFLHKKIMQNFSAQKITAGLRPEPRWQKPRAFTFNYPFAAGADAGHKYQAVMAWLLTPTADTKALLTLELVEDILLENPASPLRRALIASGLGSDLADASGLNTELKECFFAVGLKDIAKADSKRVQSIIISTLKKLVKTGISRELVEASLQKLAIAHCEIAKQPYPYGLKLWFRFIIPYLHGGNPLFALQFTRDIKDLRKQLQTPKFLEKKIEKYFLQNKHSALIVLSPDKRLQARAQKREQTALARVKNRLSAQEKAEIRKAAQALERMQEKKEDLSCLPSLGIKDIPHKIKKISPKKPAQKALASYAAKTNNIFYWHGIFPISGLSAEELALVPLFCHVLPLLGTKRKDYLALARAISAKTGGLCANFQAGSNHRQARANQAILTLSAKCLQENIKETRALCAELIADFDFSDTKALKKFIWEFYANLESGIVEEGHSLAMSLAGKNLSPVLALKELWGGVSQYDLIKKIAQDSDAEKLHVLSEKLSAIGKKLLQKDKLKILQIGEEKALAQADKFTDLLPQANRGADTAQSAASLDFEIAKIIKLNKEKTRTGRFLATAVSFVAAGFKAAPIKHPDSPGLFVLSKILSRQYLHSEIREKGGAYGGFARYNIAEGAFFFGSFRDPHVFNTLQVFAGAKKYILTKKISAAEVSEAILQVCSDLSRPASDAEEARDDYYRKIFGITDQDRLNYKKAVLRVTARDIKRIAKKYLKNNWQDYAVAVISNQEKLKETNKKIAGKKLEIKAI